MIINRIRVHNRLNGTRFSAIEFGLACLAALLIAAAFLRRGDWLIGGLALGTALNCAMVAVIAVMSWRRRDPGRRIRRLLEPDVRQGVRVEHPRLVMDTVVLTTSALVPFALSIAVIAEAIRRDSRT